MVLTSTFCSDKHEQGNADFSSVLASSLHFQLRSWLLRIHPKQWGKLGEPLAFEWLGKIQDAVVLSWRWLIADRSISAVELRGVKHQRNFALFVVTDGDFHFSNSFGTVDKASVNC